MFFVARSETTTKRSVDILGLSSEFENNYLSEIMPGISVLTIRFGYFGFICWAISKGVNPRSEDFRLLEDALAKTEYNIHSTQRFKGIRKISRGSIPPYYLQSVFSDYRSTLVRMGLLSKKDDNLTERGRQFAGWFEEKNKTLNRIPRNLDLAARNGFGEIKKSLLRLTSTEKREYRDLFFEGIEKIPDTKERARKRRKYKSLYEKLVRMNENDENEDVTNMDIINYLQKETKAVNKYALAHEMSKYLRVSYYCAKALHELSKTLKKFGIRKRITIVNAINIKPVKVCLDEIMRIKDQHWLRNGPRTRELLNLCSAQTYNKLLTKLIDRNIGVKGEKAWFVKGDNEAIMANPSEPPIPKEVAPFGIRLAPFESLTNDL